MEIRSTVNRRVLATEPEHFLWKLFSCRVWKADNNFTINTWNNRNHIQRVSHLRNFWVITDIQVNVLLEKLQNFPDNKSYSESDDVRNHFGSIIGALGANSKTKLVNFFVIFNPLSVSDSSYKWILNEIIYFRIKILSLKLGHSKPYELRSIRQLLNPLRGTSFWLDIWIEEPNRKWKRFHLCLWLAELGSCWRF